MAWCVLLPHISIVGFSELQTLGRSGRPNRRQRFSGSSCTQRSPAGLPWGKPGMGEVMDGAVQQAPQPGRQFMAACYRPLLTGALNEGSGA